MGTSQSRISDNQVQQTLVDRLRALEGKRMTDLSEKEEFVHVDETYFEIYPKYCSPNQNVSLQTTEEWEKKLLEDPKNRLALNALSANPANAVLTSRSAVVSDTQTFNVKIPLEGTPVTNQRSSGRCWLFASTNVFRVALMKKYNLDSFELSQAYLFFWDKIEKANYFLENIIDTADEPLDGRILQTMLSMPVSDGGQWDMVANLVEKYGIVPQTLYPDSYNAMNSSAMDRLITSKLREDALRLRALATSDNLSVRKSIAATKASMLREIHLVLTLMLGPPPSPMKSFTWEFRDSTGAYNSVTVTPTEFAKSLSDSRTVRALAGTDVNRLFSLVHDPRHKPLTLLTVSRLGNVMEGRPVTYVNVTTMTMKCAAIAMLKRGLPVFFGSDVGKSSDSAKGIMDAELFDYELGFNTALGMDKAERLRAGDSAMTHAMVLTGVHLDKNGAPVRWRVENSWGESAGSKGYFVMTDKWLDEFVFQVVVDPSVVGEDVKKVLKQDPVVLDLWDPMGALA